MTSSETLQQIRTGNLVGTRRLDLCCGLECFPTEIYQLADTLEILNLSGNQLSDLPDDLPRLRNLRVLFLSDNEFDHIPAVLGSCPELRMIGIKSNKVARFETSALPPRLRWLILTDNRITRLPPALGRCTELQKLMLAGNRIDELPPEMAACHALELIRLSANRMEALPQWLFSLPRLSWLGFAGNPLCGALPETEASMIDWKHLTLGDKLGEGASGTIYRASCRDRAADVAVKVFKGSITSDGLPENEVAACLAAGLHPNLIGVAGRVTGHPGGAAALVMPLISAEFRSIANPPSLDSCTRDIYPSGVSFSQQILLEVAKGLSSAGAHLHNRGIMHGDFYAHNVLWNDSGNCLLGDFGAASFHAGERLACERIEVRAFGCLLEELLERVDNSTGRILISLRELTEACLDETPTLRPLFSEVLETIRSLDA